MVNRVNRSAELRQASRWASDPLDVSGHGRTWIFGRMAPKNNNVRARQLAVFHRGRKPGYCLCHPRGHATLVPKTINTTRNTRMWRTWAHPQQTSRYISILSRLLLVCSISPQSWTLLTFYSKAAVNLPTEGWNIQNRIYDLSCSDLNEKTERPFGFQPIVWSCSDIISKQSDKTICRFNL